MSSGPFTLRKWHPDCAATAFARSVFPVPGGPYNNTPLLPLLADVIAGGGVMTLRISFLAASRPPTSSHDTFGMVGAPIASDCSIFS